MTIESQNPSAIDIIQVLAKSALYLQREFNNQITDLGLPFQLSGPRLRVLSAVFEAGEIRMSDLADILGIKARTVTDFIYGLEKEGLLMRKPDPLDGRATLIGLTSLAKLHIELVLEIQNDIAERLMINIPHDERGQFLKCLQLIIEGKEFIPPCSEGLKHLQNEI
ncbi:MarR family winged helix-turn-helix transcriptional regulator [Paenibacillus xylanexedens]|uniref:MarR family winged helix-turn-helix transcriptional regulator n=1 Tax=Paenibacillus xylanexedens TaxID=528191 RepID=UPI00119F09D8|nr:MarR family transcriptional regulator [Paenibacillus xylanexedens]